jgi:hypothetical protein
VTTTATQPARKEPTDFLFITNTDTTGASGFERFEAFGQPEPERRASPVSGYIVTNLLKGYKAGNGDSNHNFEAGESPVRPPYGETARLFLGGELILLGPKQDVEGGH